VLNLKNLKAIALYRVSTIRQTSGDDKDIPAQRELVTKFIKEHDMILVKEFVEGGVSGFKTKVDNRDALVEIKRMANKKQFDVLIVYKSDRIGRTTDESPLVVKYLNDQGVRIFSIDGTELKSDTQMDKLMTWLMFWQNETESVKISERSSDYQRLLIESGRWPGGNSAPYGYRLVNNGTKNSKGKNILDIEINEEEAEIIKLIYEKSIRHNMGFKKIALYLIENNIPPKENKKWQTNVVSRILKNPIYKGYLEINSKTGKVTSPKIDKLVILSEDVWEENKKACSKRFCREGLHISGITHNEHALLSGMVYCGHCGCKMYVWQNQRNLKEGKSYYYFYRCYASGGTYLHKCDGQLTYSIKRIDALVESEIQEYLNLAIKDESINIIKLNMENQIKQIEKENNTIDRQIKNLQKEIDDYKGAIIKVLRGESKFSEGMLNGLIEDSMSKLDDTYKRYNENLTKISEIKTTLHEYGGARRNLEEWKNSFNSCSFDQKKAIINQLIERVVISRDSVEIAFKITYDMYKSATM